MQGAYRSGDISIAYPIARSFPVITVSVITLLLGRGDPVSRLCIVGIILIVGGCFMVPLQQFKDLRLKNYLNTTCGLALLAALGTSGYTIIDDQALRLIRANDQIAIGNTSVTILYACLQAISASIWLFFYSAATRTGRSEIYQVIQANKKNAVLTGIAIQLTYGIVLISMTFVNNVSYVVGFRQLSIPLGTALGIIIFKEKLCKTKVTGVTIMFTGLIMLAAG